MSCMKRRNVLLMRSQFDNLLIRDTSFWWQLFSAFIRCDD